MANNRMFLVHIPTGLAAPLGKRLGWGWRMSAHTRQTMGDQVSLLFEVLDRDHDYADRQDDFAVALEDATGSTLATGAWRYGLPREDGLIQLEMDPPEAAGEPSRDGESHPTNGS